VAAEDQFRPEEATAAQQAQELKRARQGPARSLTPPAGQQPALTLLREAAPYAGTAGTRLPRQGE